MKWPEISELEKHVPFPEGYVCTRLSREEIPLLIDSIKTWYPDVSVGGASCYLTHEFYESEAYWAFWSNENKKNKTKFKLRL